MKVGTRLDHYIIRAKIGEGGMGEVYRAEDTRLKREVALKVLPVDLASDQKRKQRFEREAHTISQLKHPHICVLYDIGQDQGIDYLVMELIEGETLAERLRRGSIPVKETLRTAVQVAEALDAAHRQDIVHRDLKPGNVMLTRTGAKLLDFGLAKAKHEGPSAGAGSSGPDSATATAMAPLTGEGTILGTVQYMAPEQLEGRPADARSDLFALGALLYEMLAGKPAFEGDSKASMITAIMSKDPVPLAERVQGLPPTLDRIVSACLSKDPEERFQSAHDLARDLKWIAREHDSGGVSSATSRGRPSRALSLLGVGALGAVVALAIGYQLWGSSATKSPESAAGGVVRAVLALGEPVVQGRGRRSPIAISPDGGHVVYVAPAGNTTRLKVRPIDSFESVELPNTERAEGPFFSPDGNWIGYFADGALHRVPMSGGMPTRIVVAPDVRGAVWLPDDTIVYTPTFYEGLFSVPATGGEPTRLTTPDRSNAEKSHRLPRFVPEVDAVLFTIGTTKITSFDDASIGVLSLATGEVKTLAHGGASPMFLSTGHVVYGRNGSLFAARFDPARLELVGTPTPVLDGISTSATYGTAAYSVSDHGALVYLSGSGFLGTGVLAWVDREGNETPLTSERRDFLNFQISADGNHLSLEVGGANDSVWAYDFQRNVMTRLTFAGDITGTVWSPDGNRIAFAVPQPLRPSAQIGNDETGANSLYWVSLGDSEDQKLLSSSEHMRTPTSWSRDGSYLLMSEANPETGSDIWVLPFGPDGESGEPTAFVRSRFQEESAVFSPDGRWVAYTSDESGRAEVQIRAFPDGGRKVQISQNGGVYPRWRGDGRELFFRSGDQMLAVAIQTGATVQVGTPRVLFERSMQAAAYDVSPDGQRFLMVQVDEADSPDRLNLVLGWASEVEERLRP